MIDCEFELFTRVAKVLRERFNGIYVTGEYNRTPPRLPCVSIEEANNASWRNSRTTVSNDVHSAVMYEVNVYSNKESGKKAECKQIMAVVDNEFNRMGFTRTMLTPVPNLADATLYRLTARFSAIIGQDGEQQYTIYKR